MTTTVTPTPPVAPVAPEPGTPEYDAAMAAKFDKATNDALPPVAPEAKAPAQKPDHVPDKFWNAEKGEVNIEALLKSYGEAEKALTAKAPAKPAEAPKTPAEGGDTTPEAKAAAEAAKAVANAGLDMDSLSAKYAEKGTLDDADFDALAKAGIPRTMVDSYIAGQVAIAEKFEAEVIGSAGGEQAYGQMVTWAAANLDAAQIEAFNAAVNSGDAAQAKLAVAGMRAQYAAGVGSEPNLLGGGQGGGASGGYSSHAQMVADMGSPQYENDPAFRAMVSQKLAATTAF